MVLSSTKYLYCPIIIPIITIFENTFFLYRIVNFRVILYLFDKGLTGMSPYRARRPAYIFNYDETKNCDRSVFVYYYFFPKIRVTYKGPGA